ncbi:TPA: hypothetical protein RQN23_000760 [Aeromonas veronii]|nr:hypothetical protein [Aeromonas veronii]
MKNVSRTDALAWAGESITNWPTISDWIHLKANTPHGWSVWCGHMLKQLINKKTFASS